LGKDLERALVSARDQILIPLSKSMLIYFLKIFFLIGPAFASHSDKEIFNEAKERILSLTKLLYQQKGKITSRRWHFPSVEPINLLSRLDSNVLVKLLIDDVSDELLIIYFFAYSKSYALLLFRNINSLCALKDSPQNKIRLVKIFENFRKFLFKRFTLTKGGCCSNFEKAPLNSSYLLEIKDFWERGWITLSSIYEKFKDFLFWRSAKLPVDVNYDDFLSSRGFPANFKLLKNLEFLWENRLERLAKRLLSNAEFKEVSNQIKDRLDFLNSFLTYGLESMLVREYKSLYDDIQAVGIKKSSRFKNFLFLIRHFVEHLNESDCITEGLGMLASKDPEFIIVFYFIYDKEREPSTINSIKYKHLLSRNLIKMHKSVKDYIKPTKEGFQVFCKKVKEPEGINFANRILQKTTHFISEEINKSRILN
jgi:hypothetical protein